ncbi:hypothetical protein TheveDRAFT_0383 [Thermanaerovibrio velox DSM 12556]|uniref:DoxX protein n=1 Tax=Thermanaerovibrio velox DSM 12556 TaxID=926567 RepID=H0UPK3_9BACT|nr:hypothetical protein TheveDRAFT_0383 [Thermanaerovibrio velox DSM 12556]
MVGVFFIGLYLLGLLVGIAAVVKKKPRDAAHVAETLLLYQLVITVALSSLMGFVGHVFMSEKIAAQIGWASNGFQKELGFVSLGIAIAGFMCFWYRGTFWLAVIVIFSTFYLGAAVNHVKEMLLAQNFNPGNVFPAVSDVLIPLTLIACWLLKAKWEGRS